jgi:Fic family protein
VEQEQNNNLLSIFQNSHSFNIMRKMFNNRISNSYHNITGGRDVANETRVLILKKLAEQYPEYVMKDALQQSTLLSENDLERNIHYLDEEGLTEVKWTSSGFLAKINVNGISYINAEIVDRKTMKEILSYLEKQYPNYVKSENSQSLLNVDQKQLRRLFKYLEETGLVQIRWVLGPTFSVKITSHGINQLENI